ncbi:uncharacterized protein RJT20DRAFT_133886 [Scheffersomyces xylosifermentans]|uniref:uncharacterized protein n=1 Tax=Scheffersomyces xylosifermentans TaxID=1304137 RepID=UPI00315D6BF8
MKSTSAASILATSLLALKGGSKMRVRVRDACSGCTGIASDMEGCLPINMDTTYGFESQEFTDCFCADKSSSYWDTFAGCVNDCVSYDGPTGYSAAELAELYCSDISSTDDVGSTSDEESTSSDITESSSDESDSVLRNSANAMQAEAAIFAIALWLL